MKRSILIPSILVLCSALHVRAGEPVAPITHYQWVLVNNGRSLQLPDPDQLQEWRCPKEQFIAQGLLRLEVDPGGQVIEFREERSTVVINQKVRDAHAGWQAVDAPRLTGENKAFMLERVKGNDANAGTVPFSWDGCEDLMRAALSSGFLASPLIVAGTPLVFHGEGNTSLVLLPRRDGATSDAAEAHKLVVWPNPTRDRVRVGNIPSGARWSLLASTGALIRTGTQQLDGDLLLDLSGSGAGIYSILVHDASGRRVASVVVE